MARRSLSRSNSSASTLSCITVANDQGTSRPLLQSSTPPTSVTDVASISSNNTLKPSNDRSRRSNANVSSYNENTLARSARKRPSKIDHLHGARDVSGQPLVLGSEGSQERPIKAGMETIDTDWKVSNLLDQSMNKSEALNSAKRVNPLHSKIINRVPAAAFKTKALLGKRGRGTWDAGKEKLRSLGRQASLRSRLPTEPDVQNVVEPATKKTKTNNSTNIQLPVKEDHKPKQKRYLAQGLYVGQDPSFDPRYKQSKIDKLVTVETKQRKILPLPMFTGKTLLDQGRHFRLPFNIFSPLPPGQPKPEEWRKTQKNVFVGDAAEFWKTSKRLEHSTCICEPESGCGENCFNRFMFYDCDDNNCNIGPEHCTNRSFEDLRKRCKKGGKYNIGVEVIKTADRGYGVRSNRTFEPNQIIVEYTGEIITQDECDYRMRKVYKNNECFYLMVFDQNMIIDATRGSIARFVNHACEPNCKMVKWTVAGKPRMALFAGDKGIMTGDELTYDYNFDPFSSKNIQECRCGAPSCRGVLGPRPKAEKEIKDVFSALAQAGTKRKLQDALDSAKDAVQSVVSKKRKVAVPKSIKKAINSVRSSAGPSVTQTKARKSMKAGSAKSLVPNPLKGASNLSHKKRVAASVTFQKRNPHTGRAIDARLRNHRGTSNTRVSSARKNVVRTVKGTGRARNGIKLIS